MSRTQGHLAGQHVPPGGQPSNTTEDICPDVVNIEQPPDTLSYEQTCLNRAYFY